MVITINRKLEEVKAIVCINLKKVHLGTRWILWKKASSEGNQSIWRYKMPFQYVDLIHFRYIFLLLNWSISIHPPLFELHVEHRF
jgi:hypothetical protein